jgi:hypothetical protein
MIAGLYAQSHGQAMGNSWADAETADSRSEEKALVSDRFRGADDGIRTRDPHLGKVVLYQLSHVRVVFESRLRSLAQQPAR